MGERGTILTAELLASTRNKVEKVQLPAVGVKKFEPSNSWLERRHIRSAIEERRALLQEERVEKLSSLSGARWRPEMGKAEVTRKVGKHWEVVGHHQDNAEWLYPEEALYLLEMNCLELLYDGMPISVERAYVALIKSVHGCSLNEYRTYSHLSRRGYRLLRHSAKITVTRYEKQIRLDQHVLGQKPMYRTHKTEGNAGEEMQEPAIVCVSPVISTHETFLHASSAVDLAIVSSILVEKDHTSSEIESLSKEGVQGTQDSSAVEVISVDTNEEEVIEVYNKGFVEDEIVVLPVSRTEKEILCLDIASSSDSCDISSSGDETSEDESSNGDDISGTDSECVNTEQQETVPKLRKYFLPVSEFLFDSDSSKKAKKTHVVNNDTPFDVKLVDLSGNEDNSLSGEADRLYNVESDAEVETEIMFAPVLRSLKEIIDSFPNAASHINRFVELERPDTRLLPDNIYPIDNLYRFELYIKDSSVQLQRDKQFQHRRESQPARNWYSPRKYYNRPRIPYTPRAPYTPNTGSALFTPNSPQNAPNLWVNPVVQQATNLQMLASGMMQVATQLLNTATPGYFSPQQQPFMPMLPGTPFTPPQLPSPMLHLSNTVSVIPNNETLMENAPITSPGNSDSQQRYHRGGYGGYRRPWNRRPRNFSDDNFHGRSYYERAAPPWHRNSSPRNGNQSFDRNRGSERASNWKEAIEDRLVVDDRYGRNDIAVFRDDIPVTMQPKGEGFISFKEGGSWKTLAASASDGVVQHVNTDIIILKPNKAGKKNSKRGRRGGSMPGRSSRYFGRKLMNRIDQFEKKRNKTIEIVDLSSSDEDSLRITKSNKAETVENRANIKAETDHIEENCIKKETEISIDDRSLVKSESRSDAAEGLCDIKRERENEVTQLTETAWIDLNQAIKEEVRSVKQEGVHHMPDIACVDVKVECRDIEQEKESQFSIAIKTEVVPAVNIEHSDTAVVKMELGGETLPDTAVNVEQVEKQVSANDRGHSDRSVKMELDETVPQDVSVDTEHFEKSNADKFVEMQLTGDSTARVETDITAAAAVSGDTRDRMQIDENQPESRSGVTNWTKLKLSGSSFVPTEQVNDTVTTTYENASKDEISTLLRPQDCKSVGSILSRLQIFGPAEMLTDDSSVRRLKITFDVYLPTASFRKVQRSLPDYRLVVLSYLDAVPSLNEMTALTQGFQDSVPFLFAIVLNDSIAYYNYGSISLPVQDYQAS